MISNLSKSASGDILMSGATLDVSTWALNAGEQQGEPISVIEAFEHLNTHTSLKHIVIGIIGPRDATQQQMAVAERVAYRLGSLGITLICGGKSGVMEAASKGCTNSSGLLIGILPGSDPSEANSFVGIPLPTGLGEARNMIIAKSARVLVAVGGSYGTLSEVAYGLHFSKPVIGVEGAADVEGVRHVEDADAAVSAALEELLITALRKKTDG
jgi:uncharacterized protein (TIGR00725 family)